MTTRIKLVDKRVLPQNLHVCLHIGDNLQYNSNCCALHWHSTWQLISCVLAGSLLIRVYFETSSLLLLLRLWCNCSLPSKFS